MKDVEKVEANKRQFIVQEEDVVREACRRMELSDRGTRDVEEEGQREARSSSIDSDSRVGVALASVVAASIAGGLLRQRRHREAQLLQQDRSAIIQLHDHMAATISSDEAAYRTRMLQWSDKRLFVLQKSIIARQWVEKQSQERRHHHHPPIDPEQDHDYASLYPKRTPPLQTLQRPTSGKPQLWKKASVSGLSSHYLRVKGTTMDSRDDRRAECGVAADGGKMASLFGKATLAGFSRRLTSLHNEQKMDHPSSFRSFCSSGSLPTRPTSALTGQPRNVLLAEKQLGKSAGAITYKKIDIENRASHHRPSLRPSKFHYAGSMMN